MSLKSWKLHHYPTPASGFKGAERNNLNLRAAVLHCQIKWSGLDDAALTEHNLHRSMSHRELLSKHGAAFKLDYNSCALCVIVDIDCEQCPLYKVRGGYACDDASPNDPPVNPDNFDEESDRRSPWGAWTWDGDPKPMQQLLRDAYDMLTKKD